MERNAAGHMPMLCIGEIILKPELELPQGARIIGCNMGGHELAIRLVYEYQGQVYSREKRFFYHAPIATNSETSFSFHGFQCHAVGTVRDDFQTYVVYERVRIEQE